MLSEIRGLHHVTSLAASAARNNAFFTGPLGLRRVKKTVNFDAPDVYHLYYGDRVGTPGTVMTYFPFPNAARGRPGTGEVGAVAFAIPRGSRGAWAGWLAGKVEGLAEEARFGEERLVFAGPDGETLALVETDDLRAPWEAGPVPEEIAIRGFHSVALRLRETEPTAELLRFMGYEEAGREGSVTRFVVPGGNGADAVDLEAAPEVQAGLQGAGTVHHVAFSVRDQGAQDRVRRALVDIGYRVTPSIDRDYFHAIYFRSPGGVLFEVATDEPGFERDETAEHLGEALKLPAQHAHLRDVLEAQLEPLP